MQTVTIAGREVGPGQPALVVAEIGNNHDGSVGQAKKLIEAAAEAGADAVKFQTHIADAEMVPDGSPPPPHFPEDRYQLTKRMSLSIDVHRECKALAQEKGVIFMASPFSTTAIDLLTEVGTSAFKVGSGEITNLPFLDHMARQGQPILVSSGMTTLAELDEAVETIRQHNDQVIVMQCTSAYPCPYDRVNLPAIAMLSQRYGCPTGISDHTPTTYTAFAGVALGACVVEKHFTLSKRLYGPDHQASLEPEELAGMVEGIRAVEAAMLTVDKNDISAFEGGRNTFQKSIVSAAAIPKGTPVTAEMLTTKRPGTGMAPKLLNSLVGQAATRDIPANELVKPEDFQPKG